MNGVALSILSSLWVAAPAAETPELVVEIDRELAGPGPTWSQQRIAARAVETSPDVAAAAARLAEARAAAAEAWAGVLPRTRLTASYTRVSRVTNDPIVPLGLDVDAARQGAAQLTDPAAQSLWTGLIDELDALSGSSIAVPRNRYALSARAEYPVTPLFFEILPAIRAREAGADASKIETSVVQNDVALNVVEIYFEHARARGAASVAALSVREAEQNRAEALARLENGTGNQPDVLRFEARVAEAQGALAEREADVTASAEALRTFLDLDGRGPLAFEERITEAPPDPLEQPEVSRLVEQAWSQRSELAALASSLDAQRAVARSQRGGVLPQLLLAGRLDYAQPNDFFVPPNDDRFEGTWALSALIEWSPDGAWAASRRAQRADADVEAVRAQTERIRDAVRIEVTTAEARYRAAKSSFAAAQRGLAAAEEALRARRAGYELGVFDGLELIDAELDASRARLAVVDAGANLRIRLARLRRAIGEHLWEQDEGEGQR